MNTAALLEKHTPGKQFDIIGCSGYSNMNNIVCLTASADNNFIEEGIVQGTLLFVDKDSTYEKGKLNVFRYKRDRSPQYKLSRTKIPKGSFIGTVFMAVNQY